MISDGMRKVALDFRREAIAAGYARSSITWLGSDVGTDDDYLTVDAVTPEQGMRNVAHDEKRDGLYEYDVTTTWNADEDDPDWSY